MKKILQIIFTITMFFLLAGCISNSADNYKEANEDNKSTFDMYDLYQLQLFDDYEVKDCVECLSDLVVTENFCNKNERIMMDGKETTLSEALNNKKLSTTQVQCLMDVGAVKHYRIPYIIYKAGEVVFSFFKGM